MADAGRILIIPKGDYDASVAYEMLDMVMHNDISWLAKKTVIGIEPSEANSEHWARMTGTSTNASTLGGETASAWQAKIDAKANASHGTHVTYGTSASALGTSSAGSASTVSRSDHVHALPTLASLGTVPVSISASAPTSGLWVVPSS